MKTPTRFDDNPASFSTINYDDNTKNMLIKYMESIEPNAAGGHIEDCITGEILTSTTDMGYEDELYYWSSQGIYHLKKYNLAVDDDFIKHVKNKTNIA